MKRVILSAMFLVLFLIWVSGISPYVRLTSYDGSMNEAVGQVNTLLAGAMKVGFRLSEGKIAVSLVNPEDLFYAYSSGK